jgi:hypothetical protein
MKSAETRKRKGIREAERKGKTHTHTNKETNK